MFARTRTQGLIHAALSFQNNSTLSKPLLDSLNRPCQSLINKFQITLDDFLVSSTVLSGADEMSSGVRQIKLAFKTNKIKFASILTKCYLYHFKQYNIRCAESITCSFNRKEIMSPGATKPEK